MEKEARLYTAPVAANELGITAKQFRRLVKEHRTQPSGFYKNPHRRSVTCPLWSRENLDMLSRLESLETMRQRRQRPRATPEEARAKRMAKFSKKYHEDFRSLLRDACSALFSLNHYAKQTKCTSSNREEIYNLKTQLIRVLYQSGLAERVQIHTRQLSARACRRCDGDGYDWGTEECPRCLGTGMLEDAHELRFVEFGFKIGETWYSWHQPEDRVTWEYTVTDQDREWSPREKMLVKKPTRLAEKKDLLRFAIEQAGVVSAAWQTGPAVDGLLGGPQPRHKRKESPSRFDQRQRLSRANPARTTT